MSAKKGRPRNEEPIDTVIGDRIKEARKANGIKTQNGLVDKIQELTGVVITVDAVKNWERNKNIPSHKNFKLLSIALNRPISWFMNEDGAQERLWASMNITVLPDGRHSIGGFEDVHKVYGLLEPLLNHLGTSDSGLALQSGLLSTSNYFMRVLKQNIEMMNLNVDEAEFMLMAFKNAQENYKALEQMRVLELGYREKKIDHLQNELGKLKFSTVETKTMKRINKTKKEVDNS